MTNLRGGMPTEDVLGALRAMQAADLPAHGGRTLAYVYDSGLADADAVGLEALAMFASSNALDPTAFPSLQVMENDLVALAGGLVHAPPGYAGSVTSGGTESIILAVLAAREGAGRDNPTLVMPSSAHAAFRKAGKYLGVRPVVVDVDPVSLRADPRAMAEAVDDSTVLVVASAPSYAHGVVDPVGEIAGMAAERGIRCHVDACIGGWVLPHLEGVPPWDFAVDGVTSLSVDLHKYAYTPKGVSVVLHRSAALRRGHFFASADWPGYTMLNTTMQSTRSGGPLASAWAVTRHIGLDGYAALAVRARQATLTLAEAAAGIPGLRVVADPDSTLLALATDGSCDVFTVADEMLALGWYVQPQLSFRHLPPTLHLTLSAATAPSVPELVVALGGAVAAAQEAGPVAVDPALTGLLGSLDPATLDDEGFAGLLVAAGLAGSDGNLSLPTRMAPVNALLDRCPPALREALLLAVLDRLSRPSPP